MARSLADFAVEGACLDGLDFVVVLRVVLSARRGLRPSGKQTQEGLTWHGVVSFAFRHLLNTRRCSVSPFMGYICGAKDSFIETIFVECVPHLKESLENKRKRKLVKEPEITQRSQGSGDLRKIEQARWRQMLSARLTGIGSKLRYDAVNDWVEDILR